MVTGVPGGRARSALPGTPGARFADVRWVAETGSTNADALALARDGEAEGIVLVADHQTAGRGRAGRSWSAPPGASLLLSVLLRPPAALVDACTMAMAVAAVEALEEVAGVTARIKWPNDLVHPGDGTGRDRKLAGILAEADWPAGASASGGPRRPGPEERLTVVIGIGINVSWPTRLPEELADVAIACSHVTDRVIDREDLLIAVLQHLGAWYGALLGGDRDRLLAAWRDRSATLGRPVRVDLPKEEVRGTAVELTDAGHLVVELADGGRRTFAVGDVVHVRPEDAAVSPPGSS